MALSAGDTMPQLEDLDQKPFPFFTLPRALRDILYDHFLITVHGRLEEIFDFTAVSVPSKPLMLLCRQVTAEYRERAEKKLPHLTLTECKPWVQKPYSSPLSLPRAARLIPSMQVTVFITPPLIGPQRHRKWLGPLLERMHNLVELRVKMVILRNATLAPIEGHLVWYDFWVKQKALVSCEILRAPENLKDNARQMNLVSRWIAASEEVAGRFERVEIEASNDGT